jgi:LysR family transcriptional regulator, hydrogen peroxide-inducible genes activator
LPSVGSLPGIVVRPFVKPVPYRTVGLAWRPTSPRRRLFETLAEALRPLAPPGQGKRRKASELQRARGR